MHLLETGVFSLQLTKKQKLIRAMSWQYQEANPNPSVQTALQVLKQHAPSAISQTKAKHILWDSKMNLVKEYRNANHFRYTKAHEILSYLLTHRRIAPDISLYFYSGIITFKNLRSYRNERGKKVILTPSGANGYKLIKAVENKTKEYFNGDYANRSKGQRKRNRNLLMFITAIENTFFKGIKDNVPEIFNLHDHILFASINEKLDLNPQFWTVWSELTNYLNKYFDIDITVSIRPLINEMDGTTVTIDDMASDNDYNTLFYTALYLLKSQKLPLPKTWADYYAFKHYNHKSEALMAILNSVPRGMNLRTVMDFKVKERKQNNVLMAIIRQALKLFKDFSLRVQTVKLSNNNRTDLIKTLSFKHFDDLPPPLNIRKHFYSRFSR